MVNTVINFLLLQLGARLSGFPQKPLRSLLGAGAGGIYAVLALLPGLTFLSSFLWQTVFFLLICLIAYGERRNAVRPASLAFLCSTALAGFLFFLMRYLPMDHVLQNGTVIYPIGTRVLFLFSGIFYLTAALLTARTLRHGRGELRQIELHCGDSCLLVSALCDTGNTLREPISGKPVVVLNSEFSIDLLGEKLDLAALQDPSGTYTILCGKHPHRKFRLIPYRAVGVPSGLLLAVAVHICYGNRREEAFAAFSPSSVSDGGGFEALIGGVLL